MQGKEPAKKIRTRGIKNNKRDKLILVGNLKENLKFYLIFN